MKILLIGAGAVGQIYGFHLAQGGADVSFFVREKYRADLKDGMTLYPLNRRGREPVEFTNFQLVTSPEEVAKERWDQVWLCVSSTALRGQWLDDLVQAAGDAVFVSLQPGLNERDYLLQRIDDSRLVFGVIAFIAYQAPLPNETIRKPGVSYWFPPLSPNPFSGPTPHVQRVVNALKQGGCAAKKVSDAVRMAAIPTAVLMPHLAALELEDWSLASLRTSSRLAVAARASRQAIGLVGQFHGFGTWFARVLVRAFLMRIVLTLAPRFTPFDLENFLRYHFTKVGDQTRYLMSSYIAQGQAANVSVDALLVLEADIGQPGDNRE